MAKREEKRRVDVSGAAPGVGALNDVFAALRMDGLPPGPADVPVPEAGSAAPVKRGRVVLRRETAQRGGKTVVVASGFEASVSEQELDELARGVRKACGCGGTRSGREIEVQGDQPARVAEFFRGRGFRVAGVVA